MIKLIASDMDGTLLSSHLDISELNKQAIKTAAENGVEFMVATGRGYSEARPVLNEAGIHCGMITGNGAQIFDEFDNVLHTVSIDKEIVKQSMDILEEDNLYYELMTTEGVYSNNEAQRIEKFAILLSENIPHLTFKMAIAMASTQLKMLPVKYTEDYHILVDDPSVEILKVIAFNEEGAKAFEASLEKLHQLKDIHVTSSGANNLEINHVNATKGHAVKFIAEKRGISLDEVFTIGDNFNDLPMLEVAGVSFAMGNAEDKVKEVAKYQTDTNVNDGVGKAILRAIEENL